MAQDTTKQQDSPRRDFMTHASRVVMLGGLAAGYGLFAQIAGRFLYPSRPREMRWMFVREIDRFAPGQTLLYRAPTGETVNVTRQGRGGGSDDFVALSSVCPHLGCQVHWEPQNDRYFCPCHNGVFDRTGRATAGPPAEAAQSLSAYNLKVEGGLLYIETPVSSLAQDDARGEIIEATNVPRGPGHDPCLSTPLRKHG